jgi:hypothetical protein
MFGGFVRLMVMGSVRVVRSVQIGPTNQHYQENQQAAFHEGS